MSCWVDGDCPKGYTKKNLTEIAEICGLPTSGNKDELCENILERMKYERDSGGEESDSECDFSGNCDDYDQKDLIELAARCGIEIMKSDRRLKAMEELCEELKRKHHRS